MQATDRFIEQMGQLFEADGMPRIAGRTVGCLLLAEDPVTLDGLSERLKVSKASASTNTRLLESLQILERVTVPGDRRDYYRISENVHERMLELRLQRIRKTRKLLAEGLRTDAAKNPVVRKRLESFSTFFERMIDAITQAREGI